MKPAPESLSYYLAIDQKQAGPFTFEQVKQMLLEGKITKETLGWYPGKGEWEKLSKLDLGLEEIDLIPPLPQEELPLCQKEIPSSFELIRIAFQKTKEHWWRIVLAGFVYIAVAGVCQAPGEIVSRLVVPHMTSLIKQISESISLKMILLGFVFFVGILTVMTYLNNLITFGFYRYVLGILRGEKDRLELSQKGILHSWFPALLYTVVMPLILMIAALFLILPAIYLGVGYIFAPLLIVDQKLSFWTALETSRKLVHPYWGRVFLSLLFLGLIAISGIFFLLVGVFFTLPMALVGFLVLYEYFLREYKKNPEMQSTSKIYQDVMAANLFVFPGLGSWWIGETKVAIFQMLGALIGFLISLYGMGEVGIIWLHQSQQAAFAFFLKSGGWTILGGLIFFKCFWAWGFWTAWKYKKSGERISESVEPPHPSS
ncbi:MAG: DUF4339 domain-containing protein [Verrucomicrobiota bacterium]